MKDLKLRYQTVKLNNGKEWEQLKRLSLLPMIQRNVDNSFSLTKNVDYNFQYDLSVSRRMMLIPEQMCHAHRTLTQYAFKIFII
jgi:hypothetical protein